MEEKKIEWNDAQWVAVYTKARAEKKVAENLNALQLKPGCEGVRSYLPLQHQLHSWSDRKKWVDVPLFTSYVFVRITQRQLEYVRSTDGVAWVVGFGKSSLPAFVPQREIDALRRLMDKQMQVFVEQTDKLHKGAHVKILTGAFAGMEGSLVSDCKDGNFAVSVTALNSSIVFDAGLINRDMLEYLGEEDSKKGLWNK